VPHSFLEAKIDADSLILAVRPDLDLANKAAVPTATRILGEVAGLDAAADLAVLLPYLAAVEADDIVSKYDRLILKWQPP
jgi:hypothetical protein